MGWKDAPALESSTPNWASAPAVDPQAAMAEHAKSLDYKMAVASGAPAETFPQYAGRQLKEMAMPAAGAALGTVGGIPGQMAGAALGETLNQALNVTPSRSVIPEADKPDLARVGIAGAAQGVIPVAAKGVGALYGFGKSLVEPFYQSGRDAIIGRTLKTAAGGQNVSPALRTAPEFVPGSLPTVGEASGNAGLASLEKSARAISPEVKNAFQVREAAQNAARVKAIQDISGNENAMVAAVQARKSAAAPLIQQVTGSTAEVDPSRTVSLLDKIIARSPGRTQLTTTLENVKKSLYEPHPLEQRGKEGWSKVSDALNTGTFGIKDVSALRTVRTVMDRVKNGRIDADEALTQLKGVSGKAQAVQDVIAETKALMKAPDQRLRSNASELYQGARKNITDLLNAKAGDGSKLNEAISRELSVVMKSLDHQINKAEPAYGNYLKTYAEQSKPINQMDVGREIEDKAVNKLTEVLKPEAYANALSDKTAQKATGFKRATLEGTMTPQQMQSLDAIKQDVARAVQAQRAASVRGSDTIQNLAYANMIDQGGVPTFLRQFAPTEIVGNVMKKGLDTVYGRANKEIADQLAFAMLNPKEGARLIGRSVPPRFAALMEAIAKRQAPLEGAAVGQYLKERER